MTMQVSEEAIEAGKMAHWASDPEPELSDYVTAIYLAMKAKDIPQGDELHGQLNQYAHDLSLPINVRLAFEAAIAALIRSKPDDVRESIDRLRERLARINRNDPTGDLVMVRRADISNLLTAIGSQP